MNQKEGSMAERLSVPGGEIEKDVGFYTFREGSKGVPLNIKVGIALWEMAETINELKEVVKHQRWVHQLQRELLYG